MGCYQPGKFLLVVCRNNLVSSRANNLSSSFTVDMFPWDRIVTVVRETVVVVEEFLLIVISKGAVVMQNTCSSPPVAHTHLCFDED